MATSSPTLQQFVREQLLPSFPLSMSGPVTATVNAFVRFAGPDTTRDDVTPERIQQFVQHCRSRGLSPVTVAHYEQLLRRIVGMQRRQSTGSPPPDQATIERAAALAAEGTKQKDIARLLEVSPQTVSSWRTKYRNTWDAAKAARKQQAGAVIDAALFDERIAKATALVALGKPRKDIANALGVSAQTIRAWERNHAAAWQEHLDRAMQQVLATIRAQAGTDAILEDPDAYLQRAMACERWATAKGIAIFEAPEQTTLSTFYETYYRPNCMDPQSAKEYWFYSQMLRRWRLFTGDPPLREITPTLLAKFRDCILKLPGRDRIKYAKPRTAKLYLSAVQTLLDKAGPPGPRNRDAAGLLEKVPWIRPPRTIRPPVRTVPMTLLESTYLAAVAMEFPRLEGFKPPAWWRALLAVAYNTGLRRGTLFKLRMSHVDWPGRRLVIPGEIMKTRRTLIVPLNEVCLAHLRAIRTDRELVFPFGHGQKRFYKLMHQLQDAAAIPRRDHFGLQDIRRTTATVLWQTSPAAAQLTLGHTMDRVTREHYVDGGGIIARALDSMPQPAAFMEVNHAR